MASTILIKFYRFIVLLTPNNMILSGFSGKIHETRKLFFNLVFNLVQIWYILQISPARFSVFDKPLKLRVVHVRKKLKISIPSKMAPIILIKFCAFIVGYIRSPAVWHCRPFQEKCMKLENYVNWWGVNNRERKKEKGKTKNFVII